MRDREDAERTDRTEGGASGPPGSAASGGASSAGQPGQGGPAGPAGPGRPAGPAGAASNANGVKTGTPAGAPEDVEDADAAPRQARAAAVREEDIEPYTALRWVSTLFKAGAIFLAVALVGEAIAGLRTVGAGAVPILLGELARTLVFIVVLWGTGDLVRLLIDLGHDIRAQRVLLARMAYRLRMPGEHEEEQAHARSGALPPGFPEPHE